MDKPGVPPSADRRRQTPARSRGHHHPKATIAARGGSVSRPCFVADGAAMLPAFGAYTGGLDVLAAGDRSTVSAMVVASSCLGCERLFSFRSPWRNHDRPGPAVVPQ